MARILKWSNKQLLARLKITHVIIDDAQKIIDDLARKLKLCQEWTAQREALVQTPTLEQIADTVARREVKR